MTQPWADEEPECLTCGYVAYGTTVPRPRTPALVVHARYSGPDALWRGTRVAVLVEWRLGSRGYGGHLEYLPSCPFPVWTSQGLQVCDREMRNTSLSGKRREAKEIRYECPRRHRLSLFIKKEEWTWD